ncbi:MAG: RNA polymerase factor sigma-54 [Casimicrobiaceae bacterium]
MKAGLQLRLAQHLTLTPQLQQSIRLLQLSTLELREEIERAVAENPLLELEPPEPDPAELAAADPMPSVAVADEGMRILESDEIDWSAWGQAETAFAGSETPERVMAEAGGDAADAAERGSDALEEDSSEADLAPLAEDWSTASSGIDRDDDDGPEQQRARQQTLADHLLAQVPMLHLEPMVEAVLRALIYCLDDDGLLDTTAEELSAAFGLARPIDRSVWDTAVAALQSFDPPGIGARSLAECLRLQLESMPPTQVRHHALRIVAEAFEPMSKGEWARVRKVIGLTEAELAAARQLIARLTPRPAAPFAEVSAFALVPDVIVRRSRRGWTAELNPAAVPRLSVNRTYVELLSHERERRAMPLATQLQEARWLVKNVSQRFDTILRVSNEIVQRQQAFFDHGEVAMRPLVLRDVADALGLHESTVSRVTTQKYLSCPRGTFELKFFFGSHVSTDTGGAASSTAIRAMIRSLVSEEDPANPLTDNRIAELLGEQGIVVARRTVAKYRELANIAPVSQRRMQQRALPEV